MLKETFVAAQRHWSRSPNTLLLQHHLKKSPLESIVIVVRPRKQPTSAFYFYDLNLLVHVHCLATTESFSPPPPPPSLRSNKQQGANDRSHTFSVIFASVFLQILLFAASGSVHVSLDWIGQRPGDLEPFSGFNITN